MRITWTMIVLPYVYENWCNSVSSGNFFSFFHKIRIIIIISHAVKDFALNAVSSGLSISLFLSTYTRYWNANQWTECNSFIAENELPNTMHVILIFLASFSLWKWWIIISFNIHDHLNFVYNLIYSLRNLDIPNVFNSICNLALMTIVDVCRSLTRSTTKWNDFASACVFFSYFFYYYRFNDYLMYMRDIGKLYLSL